MELISVRLGAYVPDRISTTPSRLESYSLPAHLRAEVAAPVPNRAARRKARKR